MPDGALKTVTLGRLTPAAARVLDNALREALSAGDNYIGTKHIHRALLRVSGEWEREPEFRQNVPVGSWSMDDPRRELLRRDGQ